MSKPKRKVQASKRARAEAKQLRWLRSLKQIARGVRHLTSHNAGGRGKAFRFAKDRYDGEQKGVTQ